MNNLILMVTSMLFLSCSKAPETSVPAVEPPQQDGEWFPLFWNSGMHKRSWILINQDNYGIYDYDLSDAHLLGTPQNVWPVEYEKYDGTFFRAQNGEAPSAKLVTLGYEWDARENENLGFDYTITEDGDKLSYNFFSNAVNSPVDDQGLLRELGFVFDNWPLFDANTGTYGGGNHSFRESFRIGDFDSLMLTFDARITNYINTSVQPDIVRDKWMGTYITADFRYSYYNNSGDAVSSGLLGVHFANPSGYDVNGNSGDEIFWENHLEDEEHNIHRVWLHGNKIGISTLNPNDRNFKKINIDYIPLIKSYMPAPPVGMSYDDAIITGLDIYSANRGVTIGFDVKNIEFDGFSKKRSKR